MPLTDYVSTSVDSFGANFTKLLRALCCDRTNLLRIRTTLTLVSAYNYTAKIPPSFRCKCWLAGNTFLKRLHPKIKCQARDHRVTVPKRFCITKSVSCQHEVTLGVAWVIFCGYVCRGPVSKVSLLFGNPSLCNPSLKIRGVGKEAVRHPFP